MCHSDSHDEFAEFKEDLHERIKKVLYNTVIKKEHPKRKFMLWGDVSKYNLQHKCTGDAEESHHHE